MLQFLLESTDNGEMDQLVTIDNHYRICLWHDREGWYFYIVSCIDWLVNRFKTWNNKLYIYCAVHFISTWMIKICIANINIQGSCHSHNPDVRYDQSFTASKEAKTDIRRKMRLIKTNNNKHKRIDFITVFP